MLGSRLTNSEDEDEADEASRGQTEIVHAHTNLRRPERKQADADRSQDCRGI